MFELPSCIMVESNVEVVVPFVLMYSACKPTEYMIDEKKLCVPCHPNSHAKDFNSSSYSDCVCNEGFVGSPLDIVLCEGKLNI